MPKIRPRIWSRNPFVVPLLSGGVDITGRGGGDLRAILDKFRRSETLKVFSKWPRAILDKKKWYKLSIIASPAKLEPVGKITTFLTIFLTGVWSLDTKYTAKILWLMFS